MAPSVSILVVTAAPDERESTGALLETVDDLRGRGWTVSLWFLRDHGLPVPPGARVIDSLRTWSPAARIDGTGIPMLGDLLRGARLRRWFRQAAPDVVLLDDGLGSRVLPRSGASVRRVLRFNAVPPADLAVEGPASTTGQVVLAAPGSGAPAVPGAQTLRSTALRDLAGARRAGRPDAVRSARELVGLPEAAPIITGWGSDGWIDGPDLFVRMLWFLEHRHGVQAHGVWFGPLGVDPHEATRLREEAERCGVADRFHLRPPSVVALRLLGDATFLPHREPSGRIEVLDAVASGSTVVTFHDVGVQDLAIVRVDALDVEAAAGALADALGRDRAAAIEEARQRLAPLDVSQWDDELVQALRPS